MTDYRTAVSGVRPQDMKNGLQVTFVIVMQLYIFFTARNLCCFFSGEDLEVVLKEVAGLLKGRVLVGHALKNDLHVRQLYFSTHGWLSSISCRCLSELTLA